MDILNYCCNKEIISHKIKQTKSLQNLTCHLPDQISFVNSINFVPRKNLRTKCFKFMDNINELNRNSEYSGFAYPSKDNNIIMCIKKTNSIVYITSDKYFQSRLKYDINVFDKLSMIPGEFIYLTENIKIEKQYSVLILLRGSSTPEKSNLISSEDLTTNIFVLIENKIGSEEEEFIASPIIIEGIQVSQTKLFARLDNCWYSFNADFIAKFNDNISDIINREESKKIIFTNIDGKDKLLEQNTYNKYSVMSYNIINFDKIKYLCVNYFKVVHPISNSINIFYLKDNKHDMEKWWFFLHYYTLLESKNMLELNVREMSDVYDLTSIEKYTENVNEKNRKKISVDDMTFFVNPSKNYSINFLWRSRKICMPDNFSNNNFEDLLARKKKIMTVDNILNVEQTDAGSTLFGVEACNTREYISLILKFLCFFDYDTFLNVTRWRFNFFTLMNSTPGDNNKLKVLIFDKNNIWNEYSSINKSNSEKCQCEILEKLFDRIVDIYCEYFGSGDFSYSKKFLIIYTITGRIPIYTEVETSNLIDVKVKYDILKLNILCKDNPPFFVVKKLKNDDDDGENNESDETTDDIMQLAFDKDILAISESENGRVCVHLNTFDIFIRNLELKKIWIPRLNLNTVWTQTCITSIETSEFSNKHLIKINSPNNANSTILYRLSFFYFSPIENEIYFSYNKYAGDDSVLNIPFNKMIKIHHCPSTFYFEIEHTDHFFLIIKSINSQCTISVQLFHYSA
jgi:hypothetical protein